MCARRINKKTGKDWLVAAILPLGPAKAALFFAKK
jgi:hypothetical protein